MSQLLPCTPAVLKTLIKQFLADVSKLLKVANDRNQIERIRQVRLDLIKVLDWCIPATEVRVSYLRTKQVKNVVQHIRNGAPAAVGEALKQTASMCLTEFLNRENTTLLGYRPPLTLLVILCVLAPVMGRQCPLHTTDAIGVIQHLSPEWNKDRLISDLSPWTTSLEHYLLQPTPEDNLAELETNADAWMAESKELVKSIPDLLAIYQYDVILRKKETSCVCM